jgi:hypothetical protein
MKHIHTFDYCTKSKNIYMRILCYLFKINSSLIKQNLYAYDYELGFVPVFLDINKTIKINILRLINGNNYH